MHNGDCVEAVVKTYALLIVNQLATIAISNVPLMNNYYFIVSSSSYPCILLGVHLLLVLHKTLDA